MRKSKRKENSLNSCTMSCNECLVIKCSFFSRNIEQIIVLRVRILEEECGLNSRLEVTLLIVLIDDEKRRNWE